MKEELRRSASAPEVRQEGDGLPHIAGYAAMFDAPAMIEDFFGQFEEVIRRGAFADAIQGDVRALLDHRTWALLGRTKARTLTLKEDERGLWFDIVTPNTSAGRDAVEMVRRGDITGASFQFRVKEQRWTQRDTGIDLRELIKVDLVEVSPTGFPAYEQTEVGLRTGREQSKELRPWRDPAALAAIGEEARARQMTIWRLAGLL